MKMNKLIDHTLLKADATRDMIKKLCDEAITYDFASVCVNSSWVSYCAQQLNGSTVKVCSVVGFPLGAMSTKAKAYETQCVIEDGADEIDMVMNIGAFKDQDYELVQKDIEAVVEAANHHCVKVILETCLLTKEEIIKACELCVAAKATYVKTSTGFSLRGATIDDVKLMKSVVKDNAKVKAAGGVKSYEDLLAMVDAGANRIGSSSGVMLMESMKNK